MWYNKHVVCFKKEMKKLCFMFLVVFVSVLCLTSCGENKKMKKITNKNEPAFTKCISELDTQNLCDSTKNKQLENSFDTYTNKIRRSACVQIFNQCNNYVYCMDYENQTKDPVLHYSVCKEFQSKLK